MPRFTGGCLCGDVRFEIDSDPMFSGHCHCRDCQRATGGGHGTVAAFPVSAIRVVKGETRAFECRADSGGKVVREFCPRCGSRLFTHGDYGPGRILVAVGALDEPDAVTPMAHIYAASRLAWDVTTPGLPTFPGMPPGG